MSEPSCGYNKDEGADQCDDGNNSSGDGCSSTCKSDAVCGNNNFFCNFIALFIQSCDTATYWLRSADDVQVRTYSNAPARSVYLTGGYEAIFGASACLSGEDDGIVQHASQYACNGSATTGYNNSNVCNNSAKQESSGFLNLDVAHENHSDERDDSDAVGDVALRQAEMGRERER